MGRNNGPGAVRGLILEPPRPRTKANGGAYHIVFTAQASHSGQYSGVPDLRGFSGA